MRIETNTTAGMLHNLLAGLRRSLKRFSHNKDGLAAIEFGFVALPFIALLFAIIETGLVFFAGQTLETAVADSSRLILTGQAKSGAFKADDFKKAVCDRISGLMDCASLLVDVRGFSDFTAIKFDPVKVDDQGNLVNAFTYDQTAANTPEQTIVVRLFYPFPVYVNLWNPSLANIGTNKRLLVATAAFRTEPF
jgi:Flp pilus assembly protein TadG